MRTSLDDIAIEAHVLEANLRALATHSPEAAERIRVAEPRAGVRAARAEDGSTSVEAPGASGGLLALTSRRRPIEEAERLAGAVDIRSAAVLVVSGFGAGHHVRALARRVDRAGLVIVFEPNVDLLRAVLERVDQSAWLGSSNLRVLTDAEDRGAMSEALRGCEGLVGMGVSLVEHPPSRALIGTAGATFYKRFSEVVDAAKMAVLTSLVQVRQTIRNQTQNLDRYVGSGGIEDLRDLARGCPAIVISAGPSLARNIDLLKRDGVRDRFVLVAVQTVLKRLLTLGIRPHIVTALDYSEISRRFYEGLTREDVEGITLIAEAKVNPAVLEAWPGALRTPSDNNLDRLLGDGPWTKKGSLPAGATVAHLAYYVARHLGCDPVALIGQDLGFTDGQYYGDGAAIHGVWGGELNGFNTLEMLEWQRIVRMGAHLRRATDLLGRDVFSDEQMTAYLAQFERDFKSDVARGLTVIDATEGGVSKQHTTPATLAEFIDQHWDGPNGCNGLPGQLTRCVEPTPDHRGDGATIERAADPRSGLQELVGRVRRQVFRVGQASRQAEGLLSELIEHHQDTARVNRTIGKLDGVTREAMSLEPGYGLVHMLSQTGTFQRIRADRLIFLDTHIDEHSRQRRQAERDRVNVQTLASAADDLGAMLDDCVRTLGGGPRVTREPPRMIDGESDVRVSRTTGPCDALILHTAEDADVLARTLALATSVPGVRAVRVATLHEPGARRALELARAASGTPCCAVEIVPIEDDERWRYRRAVMRAARAPAPACWRGGIGNASVFDEAFDPVIGARIAEQAQAESILVIGAAWTLMDPALCAGIIARLAEDPTSMRMTFSQAVPGVAGCAVTRELVQQIVGAASNACDAIGVLGTTFGALLGYNRLAPIGDLIATPRCVDVEAALRDAGVRAIADTPARRAFLDNAKIGTSDSWRAAADRTTLFDEVVLAGSRIGEAHVERVIDEVCHAGSRPMVTIGDGGDDPCDHTGLESLVRAVRSRGLVVHVRSSLTARSASPETCAQLLAATGAEIVSVDLFADRQETYRTITGRTDFDAVQDGLTRLLSSRLTQGNFERDLGPLLVVPRIMRCEAAYGDIETFYHRWLHFAGCAVIDPPRNRAQGDRIRALSLPEHAAARLARSTRVVAQ